MKRFFYGLFPLLLLTSAFGQDWIRTGTGLGVEKVRIAVPDFKAASQDPKNTELLKAFNDTLWNDLDNAGIFDLVSKSFYPLGPVGAPTDVRSEEHTSELQSRGHLVCRLLLEKKKKEKIKTHTQTKQTKLNTRYNTTWTTARTP